MEEQEAVSLSSTFPNPPPFWKDFTTDKLTRYRRLRKEFEEREGEKIENGQGFTPPLRIPALPDDLINLQPPAEPADGRWRVFGDQYMLHDQLPTLQEQGIANLPAAGQSSARDAKHYDRAFELKRLAKSLLLNFLELAGTLARGPARAEDKANDLRILFLNIHHILNEYRPHQARESVIEMMQDHLDRIRTETLSIRTQVDKARRVLEGLASMSIAEALVLTAEQRAEGKSEGEGEGGVEGGEGEGEDGEDSELGAWQRDIWASADVLLS